MRRERRLHSVVDDDGDVFFRAQVHAAHHGHADALGWIYEEYVGMVHGYFRACSVNDADDLTSEVFVGMLRSLDRFEGGERQFRTWLMTIAHRRRVDYFRRAASRPHDATDAEIIERHLDHMPSAADQCRTVDPRLPAGMSQLTEDQREILAMRFLADMSLQEIADATERRVGAIKSLQKRAIESLRRSVPDLRTPEVVR